MKSTVWDVGLIVCGVEHVFEMHTGIPLVMATSLVCKMTLTMTLCLATPWSVVSRTSARFTQGTGGGGTLLAWKMCLATPHATAVAHGASLLVCSRARLSCQ